MKSLKIFMVLICFLSTEVFSQENNFNKNTKKKRHKKSANKTKKNRKVGEIKNKDRRIMKNRVESKDFDFISFGPTWLFSLDRPTNRDANFQLGGGKLWEVNPNAAVKFRADVMFAPHFSTFMSGLGLGTNYYFNATDFSPYVGGDLGMAYFYNNEVIELENGQESTPNRGADSRFGFMIGLNTGLALYRTSDTHLLIEPNIQWLLSGSYPLTVGVKLSLASTGLFSGN